MVRLRELVGGAGRPVDLPELDLCLEASPHVSARDRADHCTRLIEGADPALRARLHNARGLAYRDLGRGAAARTEHDRAIALDGSNETFFLDRAVIALELGDPVAALADTEHVLAGDPRCVRACEVRADSLSALRRPQEALAAIDRALAATAPTAGLLRRRGSILIDVARPREAVESLSAALALEPDDVQALERRAASFLMLEEPERAIVDLDRALALEPRSRRVQATLGSAWATIDAERALRHFGAALAIDGDDAPTFGDRARLLSELGEHTAAAADLDRAVALAPDEAAFRRDRAVNALEAGRLADAEADLVHGLGVDHDNPAMIAVLARIATIRGDAPHAGRLLARVLARHPHHPGAHCVAGWRNLAEQPPSETHAASLAEARTAFDRALEQRDGTLSRHVRWTALYGRGLARRRAGDVAGGSADLEAARAIRPDADAIVAAWNAGPPGAASA